MFVAGLCPDTTGVARSRERLHAHVHNSAKCTAKADSETTQADVPRRVWMIGFRVQI